MSNLVEKFGEYSHWRSGVVRALERYRDAIQAAGLADEGSQQRITRTLARLAEDRMTVAFVAEFSRGKSELINAIFFAGYGQRILPSSVGRTTMCPTELMYDASLPPSIRLLPIETRATSQSTSDLRAQPVTAAEQQGIAHDRPGQPVRQARAREQDPRAAGLPRHG